MSPCRAILTLYALSLAVGCLAGLALANRWLAVLDAERERERRKSLTAERDWLIRDTAEKGLVFERDAGATAWSQN